MKKIYLLILLSFAILYTYSQSEKETISFDSTKIDKLYFKFENTNFLKNNEYFNRFKNGETILGYYIIPQLELLSSDKIKLNAGIFLFDYAGRDKLYKVSPYFRFNFKANKHLNLIMGNIIGTVNHNLIEPMFSNDLYLKRHNETGMQFLYNSNKFNSDLWCDWQYASINGDTAREKMLIGNSSKYNLFNSSKFNFSILYQMTLSHKGGQTNRNSYVQSIFNTAEGIESKFQISKLTIGLQGFYLTYNDYSPQVNYKYTYGWANYENLYFSYRNFTLGSGFWYSHHYITSTSDYFFSSKSSYYKNYYEPNRNIIIAKLEYNKSISNGFSVKLAYQTYYDVINSNYDYYYLVYLIFNRDFFIKKIHN